MMPSKSFVFRFDDVEVREREFTLTKAGKVLSMEPKAFRALLFLLHNPQKLITKDELLNAVWGDTAVTEGSLTRCIWLLRSVLGDDIRSPRYIETVPTVGYRFVAAVEERVEPSESAIAPVVPEKSDGPETAVQGPRTKTFSRRWIWMSATALMLIVIAGVARSIFWHRSLPPRIRSVAVLPLQNLSSGPNTEYFADGMTEELNSDLSATDVSFPWVPPGITPAERITLKTPAAKPSKRNTMNPQGEMPSKRSISQPRPAPTSTPPTSSLESRKPLA